MDGICICSPSLIAANVRLATCRAHKKDKIYKVTLNYDECGGCGDCSDCDSYGKIMTIYDTQTTNQ